MTEKPPDMLEVDDVLEHYLPSHFLSRLPTHGRAWRGRTVLLLWRLGYPLEMAWSLGLADDPEQAAFYEATIADLDDARLIGLLNATAEARGDGSDLEWIEFGLVRTSVDPKPSSHRAT